MGWMVAVLVSTSDISDLDQLEAPRRQAGVQETVGTPKADRVAPGPQMMKVPIDQRTDIGILELNTVQDTSCIVVLLQLTRISTRGNRSILDVRRTTTSTIIDQITCKLREIWLGSTASEKSAEK